MDLDPSGVDNLSWVRLVWKGLNDICWDTSLVSSSHVCIHYGNFSKNQLREIGMFNTSENHLLLQVNVGRLLCLVFLYRWHFLNKISLYWPLNLTTQPSTSKLSDKAINTQSLFWLGKVGKQRVTQEAQKF